MKFRRDQLKHLLNRFTIASAAALLLVSILLVVQWNNRPLLSDVAWPPYPEFEALPDAVTVTWLGVSTLLFDDGETQILIDGFISRPSVADILFDVPVRSNAAEINFVLDEYDMRRLAAIIPTHSHFDHAMDIAAIANRSSASILGSDSTAQIARGAGVPEDQISVIGKEGSFVFGNFTVTMIASAHAPIGWGGAVPFAGEVTEPLTLPAPVSAWRSSKNYSIIVAHPQGTTLVQGSAGFLPGALDKVQADVVMLGTWGLDSLGHSYAEQYWLALVTSTGAKRILPIHFEDYTRPFGEIELSPRLLDDFVATASHFEQIRAIWDNDARLYLPEFGKRVVLYSPELPET